MNMKKPVNKKCLKFIFCKLLQCQHLQDCTIKWLHRENRVIRSKSHNIFDFPIDFFSAARNVSFWPLLSCDLCDHK